MVWCNCDFDYGIDFGWIIFSQLIDEFLINFIRGQFDDVVVFVRQFQFVFRGYYVVVFNVVDIVDFDGDIEIWNIGVWFIQNDSDVFVCIGCVIDDLFDVFVGFDLVDFQFICIRVFFSGIDFGDGKFRQVFGRVCDFFYFEIKVGQGVEDFVKRSVCVQVVF